MLEKLFSYVDGGGQPQEVVVVGNGKNFVHMIQKAGKDHKIPDALSRLQAIDTTHDKDAPGELENLPDIRPEQWLEAPRAYAGETTETPPADNLFPDGQLQPAPKPTAHLISMSPTFR